MPRFVIVSFLVLGWAFYELSGGAEFVPRGVRPPPPEPQAAAEPQTEPAATAAVEQKAPVIAPRQPRRTGEDDRTGEGTRRAALKAQQAARAARLAALRDSLGRGADLYPGLAGGLALEALEEGAAGLREASPEPAATQATAPAPPVEPDPDLREVTGTRVNMRNGPGTIYPVIARLAIGQEVEVLSASGTGWLRLRTVPDRRVGWVAASLISKKKAE